MRICIVEDEAVWRDKIKAVIEEYCMDNALGRNWRGTCIFL